MASEDEVRSSLWATNIPVDDRVGIARPGEKVVVPGKGANSRGGTGLCLYNGFTLLHIENFYRAIQITDGQPTPVLIPFHGCYESFRGLSFVHRMGFLGCGVPNVNCIS